MGTWCVVRCFVGSGSRKSSIAVPRASRGLSAASRRRACVRADRRSARRRRRRCFCCVFFERVESIAFGDRRSARGVSHSHSRASARPRRRLTAVDDSTRARDADDDATRTGRARWGVRDGGFCVRIARGRGAVDARGGRRVWGDCVVSRGRARAHRRAGIDLIGDDDDWGRRGRDRGDGGSGCGGGGACGACVCGSAHGGGGG